MIALFREDLIQFRAGMAPNARGKRAVDAMLLELTNGELRLERELCAVVDANLARDPEYLASRG